MQRLIFCLLILVFAGCQPEVDFGYRDQTYTSLQEFFARNQSPQQLFTANSSAAIKLEGKQGSKISFPANAFVTVSDNTPVTGAVDIELKEIITPGDMILSNMPTMSGGLPLESGGEFYIRVTKSNQLLKLAPGKGLQIQLPNTGYPMGGMKVFNGVPDPAGTVNWVPNNTQANFIMGDTLGTARTLFADSINWINCDRFINEPKITYTFNAGNCPNLDSTVVCLHLTGRNSVIPVHKTNNIFSSDVLIAVPATMVSICIKNGMLYSSIAAVNLQNGQSTTMNFSPTTEDELKKRLKALR